VLTLICLWCKQPFSAKRSDALFCSASHRQARHRAKIRRATIAVTGRPLKFAYADPPYPGKAHLYRQDPGYAGEVDHEALLSRLEQYDGWALSTSAEALPRILALCVARSCLVRVCGWYRGARSHKSARLLNAWEPVILWGGRRLLFGVRGDGVTDFLFTRRPRRRVTLPGAVIGMKRPEVIRWIFELLGAGEGDTFDDLYPGSGMVGRCWQDYCSPAPAGTDTRLPGPGVTPRDRGRIRRADLNVAPAGT
jgi:hypothetical protein